MRILNIRVEQVGFTRDGRGMLVARGRDVVSGWGIGFVVPAAKHDIADAMPWASVSAVDWE